MRDPILSELGLLVTQMYITVLFKNNTLNMKMSVPNNLDIYTLNWTTTMSEIHVVAMLCGYVLHWKLKLVCFRWIGHPRFYPWYELFSCTVVDKAVTTNRTYFTGVMEWRHLNTNCKKLAIIHLNAAVRYGTTAWFLH